MLPLGRLFHIVICTATRGSLLRIRLMEGESMLDKCQLWQDTPTMIFQDVRRDSSQSEVDTRQLSASIFEKFSAETDVQEARLGAVPLTSGDRLVVLVMIVTAFAAARLF